MNVAAPPAGIAALATGMDYGLATASGWALAFASFAVFAAPVGAAPWRFGPGLAARRAVTITAIRSNPRQIAIYRCCAAVAPPYVEALIGLQSVGHDVRLAREAAS